MVCWSAAWLRSEEGSKTRAGAEQTKKVSMLDLEKVVDTVTKRAVPWCPSCLTDSL